MTTWALIPCSKAKADHACTAREMYWPSALFRGAMQVAEMRGETPLILSAKYGVLEPDRMINPYDMALSRPDLYPALRKLYQQEWEKRVVAYLMSGKCLAPGDKIVSYVGSVYAKLALDYVRPLVDPDSDGTPGITIEEPLKGKKPGKRLAWFKQELTTKEAA